MAPVRVLNMRNIKELKPDPTRGRATWCILRDSESLKYAIEYKMEQKKYGPKELAKIAGVRLHRIYDYLGREHEGSTRAGLTQKQVLKLAEALDIKIELKVSLL